jgi:hypothetical protein
MGHSMSAKKPGFRNQVSIRDTMLFMACLGTGFPPFDLRSNFFCLMASVFFLSGAAAILAAKLGFVKSVTAGSAFWHGGVLGVAFLVIEFATLTMLSPR